MPSARCADRALAQRARARGERADGRQLGLAAQELRVRRARAQRLGQPVGDGDAAAGLGVDELRVHPVAGGEEAVLLDDLGRERLAIVGAPERLAPDQALHQRGERRGVAHARLGVHDPDLDRPQPRLQPRVPPQERRLGDRVAADQHVDRLHVGLVAVERARRARARERLEDRDARRGQAAVAALPEGRVGRQRQQQRQLLAQAVERSHGGVLVGHRHVDVQREGRLAAGELAHRRVEELVAGARRDLGVLPARQRVRAGDGGGHAHRLPAGRPGPAAGPRAGGRRRRPSRAARSPARARSRASRPRCGRRCPGAAPRAPPRSATRASTSRGRGA